MSIASSYRVVDLTDERGNLAAFLLAGLGAEVVLVEPPDGGAGRRRGPFAGPGGPERSLSFWGWNRGKRSVVIDLSSYSGQATLERLSATADVVIESGAVPVDLERLRAVNQRLITVTISAFGTAGPKSGWPATDLTVHASACHLAMSGDEDRPPVRTLVPQAFLHAAADAATGALLALTERSTSGQGQHIEVTAQRSMTACTQGFILAAALGASPVERMSGGLRMGSLQLQGVWPLQRRQFVPRDVSVPGEAHWPFSPETPHGMDLRGGLLRRRQPGTKTGSTTGTCSATDGSPSQSMHGSPRSWAGSVPTRQKPNCSTPPSTGCC